MSDEVPKEIDTHEGPSLATLLLTLVVLAGVVTAFARWTHLG